MPLTPHPTLPKAAKPRHAASFDIWNSSATGHQRAEAQPGKGWRAVRDIKLHSQFKAVDGGGGARLQHPHSFFKNAYGDEDEDVLQTKSVVDMLRKPGTMDTPKQTQQEVQTKKGIFDGLTVYVNGSTYPLISDHKLKRVLLENGASMAMHLGRRRVTHVVLGRPSGKGDGGAEGGLAGGKMEKEIRRGGGGGIKYVGVEWVLESVKAGVRLSEARFANVKVAAKAQPSVLSMARKGNN
ncbi:hypothetical protein VHEMI10192 [[Torrubiella] hemipterigena]|uniref:BRCT domain-containing protein n=1 Tax=[Torrubiella] hemipterigena TaxID=1531966 RepID=A0A0A1TRH7_9HYPO|nr:hypothetical protein VHEMI10192 [[Torrubiella] hemipterigena]